MKKHLSKRRVVVSAIVLTLAIASGVAYAYWTSTGSGSGTANALTPSGTLTLHATGFLNIYPGGSKSVTFTADNTTGSDGYVATIVFGSVTSSDVPCQTMLTANTGQFAMPTVTSNTVVPAGASGLALTGTGTLSWTDLAAVDQGACKGKSLTLNVTST
ncbi:MAG: hypothetical protein ABSC51_09385 [Gaiellaceae bacterium]|jgi:hypothetical protein